MARPPARLSGAMQPDLSPARDWLAGRGAPERKAMGQWVTPWPVVEAVARRAVDGLGPTPRVIEPACGDARFLIAVARLRPDARLLGLDADPAAIAAARATLAAAGVHAELRCADALAEPLPPADLIIGNPPWVRVQNLPLAQRRALWAQFSTATDKNDLFSCFVEHALDAAPRIAFVLPTNWLTLTSFAALRARVLRAGLDAVYELPDQLFDATVRSVALFCDPADRRTAGTFDELSLVDTGSAHLGTHTWALDGAPPELPGQPLGELVAVHMGVVCGDYPRYVHDHPSGPLDRPTCRGRDVARWSLPAATEWLTYDPSDMLARKPWVAPKHAGLFDLPEKVVVAGASGRVLRAAVDQERRFPLDSCYVALPKDPRVDAWGIAGLLNSDLVSAWYGARYRAVRVKGVELVRIPAPPPPWPRIADAARARDEAGLEAAVREAYHQS
jgi:hypothetical protein